MKLSQTLKKYTKFMIVLTIVISIFFLWFRKSSYDHTTKTMHIIGRSMEPTLYNWEWVKVSSDITHIKRGDIITFHLKTLGNLVKRVIALPWDKVIFGKDGYIWINEEKQEEIYTRWIKYDPRQIHTLLIQLENYQQKIPKDMYLVLGDNRWSSLDSGEYGMISSEQIIGKIVETNP